MNSTSKDSRTSDHHVFNKAEGCPCVLVKLVVAAVPLIPFLVAIWTSITGRNRPINYYFAGPLNSHEFSQLVIIFSCVASLLLVLTHRKVSQCVRCRLNKFFKCLKCNVITRVSNTDDGQSERREALVITAVFVLVVVVAMTATDSPTDLFHTPLGGAAIALGTLQLLVKLGTSAAKQYRFILK